MARDNSKKLTGIFDIDATKKIVEDKSEKKVSKIDKEKEVLKEQAASDKLMQEIEKAKEKKTVEDTHARVTFLLERGLQSRLDTLASTQPRGFKTKFLNIAVQSLLNELEDK